MTGTAPGPLEAGILAALADRPRLAIDLSETVGRGIHLVTGMLRGLRRRGLVVDEMMGDPPVCHWRLAEPRRAP